MLLRAFLSSVTDRTASANRQPDPLRRWLADELRKAGTHCVYQEFLIEQGVNTLVKLARAIEHESEVVLHVVGEDSGSIPPKEDIHELLRHCGAAAFRQRFPPLFENDVSLKLTYTQWEAWLAKFYGRDVLCGRRQAAGGPIAAPNDDGESPLPMNEHGRLLKPYAGYVIEFATDREFLDQIKSALLRRLQTGSFEQTRVVHLPYPPLGTLFKGRDEFLAQLRDSLLRATLGATAIVGKAVHGLGGVGKTRLAVEYAWQHARDYTAVLFVVAETLEDLRRNLAALVGPLVLNLSEQHATEEEVRVAAALRWLRDHLGWLLILDNVDSQPLAEEVEKLLAWLHGGHVLITSRLGRWSESVESLELDVLRPEHAAEFLLQRTQPKSSGRGRHLRETDDADAAKLARDLAGLALALEQAGAYIAHQRISLADYRQRWLAHEPKVQEWRDQTMHYPRSVAVTWQTTLDQLGPLEVRLLEVLAWFAPEPIPESVVLSGALDSASESAVTEAVSSDDLRAALANLADYSMIRWDTGAETVAVHRVVQEILRSRQKDPVSRLTTALLWLKSALPVRDPGDVRTWRTWEPLRPHVAFATAAADQRQLGEPTSFLMGELGRLLSAKALHADAEPLMARVVRIFEKSLGANHPNVATAFNNLAQLLKATNRLAEAEPLMRRTLAIDEQSFGPDHPNVALDLNNLAQLLQDTNRLAEAEPLMHRSVEIARQFGQHTGHEHPHMQTYLTNYRSVLLAMNRSTDEIDARLRDLLH